MIKPEQVPMEVCEALQNALLAAFSQRQETTYNKIIAAALNAWPGGEHKFTVVGIDAKRKRVFASSTLILPLPQETRDDE